MERSADELEEMARITVGRVMRHGHENVNIAMVLLGRALYGTGDVDKQAAQDSLATVSDMAIECRWHSGR